MLSYNLRLASSSCNIPTLDRTVRVRDVQDQRCLWSVATLSIFLPADSQNRSIRLCLLVWMYLCCCEIWIVDSDRICQYLAIPRAHSQESLQVRNLLKFDVRDRITKLVRHFNFILVHCIRRLLINKGAALVLLRRIRAILEKRVDMLLRLCSPKERS